MFAEFEYRYVPEVRMKQFWEVVPVEKTKSSSVDSATRNVVVTHQLRFLDVQPNFWICFKHLPFFIVNQ